ncbi:MAG: plant virulence effector HPE1-like domain-containing protein [Rhizobiaceae bacterium]|nr:plant virulence effector HPE1-like domain-containing protein [Rhizobiaceae bacterium]
MIRPIILTAALVLTTGSAVAGGSVIDVTSKLIATGSIISVDCTECPPLKDKTAAPVVSGVETHETEIDGTKKIIQTDNMLGGSPVRHVRNAPASSPSVVTEYSGESSSHENGGTSISSGDHGTIHAGAGMMPGAANDEGEVTVTGGGDFNVDEVAPETASKDGVDGVSQTSSVDMNDAQHDNVEPENTAGPEIIELRPTQ